MKDGEVTHRARVGVARVLQRDLVGLVDLYRRAVSVVDEQGRNSKRTRRHHRARRSPRCQSDAGTHERATIVMGQRRRGQRDDAVRIARELQGVRH